MTAPARPIVWETWMVRVTHKRYRYYLGEGPVLHLVNLPTSARQFTREQAHEQVKELRRYGYEKVVVVHRVRRKKDA